MLIYSLSIRNLYIKIKDKICHIVISVLKKTLIHNQSIHHTYNVLLYSCQAFSLQQHRKQIRRQIIQSPTLIK